MINLLSLVQDTGAYKTVKNDKKAGRLSHAYLILTADGDNLDGYLSLFAKLIACKSDEICGECRACKLIDDKCFPDVYFYPKDNAVKESKNITVEDVNEIIGETFLRPIESDKKIFVISHGENLSPAVQNKLLKTLEEPPENVYILIGATVEYPLLSTVKSRLKKIEIPLFGAEKLFLAMRNEYPDAERLKNAIACGDGTLGKASALYFDPDLIKAETFVTDMALNMLKSSQVLDYSVKYAALKIDFAEFLDVAELFYRDFLAYICAGKSAVTNKTYLSTFSALKGYNEGAVIYILEQITETRARLKANANVTMVCERLFFQILEGKYRWQKL